ncbi:MAG: hypothetical protein GF350_01550 [Chitinivibrionales bacterium]|nr:hypothetical protein [Chitinivibrionales bacterium]
MHNTIKTFLSLIGVAACLSAQSWVEINDGPKPVGKDGDDGTRRDAIIRSEYLDLRASPATTPGGATITYVHPSCIDETKEGTIVIGCNAGTSEGEGSNRVFVTRKPVGGEWSVPQMIQNEGSIDYGVMYQARHNDNDTIICGYWWPTGCCDEGGFQYSVDDGQTWSDIIACPPSDLWTSGNMTLGMNHPLEFPNGDLWFPSADFRTAFDCDSRITKVPWGSYINTANWTAADVEGTSQADAGHYMGDWLVLDPDYQHLMRFTRYNFKEGTYFKNSYDGGATWEDGWTKVPQDLSNGMSCVSLSPNDPNHPLNGYHLVTGSKHGTRRGRMDVCISDNPAANEWTRVLELNFIPWNGPKYEENADPTIFQSRDGSKVHLLFTGRDGAELKYYLIDAYKLCDVDATVAGRVPGSGINYRHGTSNSIAVFGPSGKCLYRKDNLPAGEFELSRYVPGLSTGMYYVSIRNRTGVSVVKRFITN